MRTMTSPMMTIARSSTMSGASRLSAAGGSGLSAGAEGSGGCLRRAGGEAAGCEASEAVRKLCFRYRPHQRAGEDSRLIPLCPSGQVFRHRSESGDDGCLAGRLTVAQSQVSEARRSRDCGVLLRGVNRQGRVCGRRALSRHRYGTSERSELIGSLLPS